MASLRITLGSLLCLAASTSAQFLTVTQSTQPTAAAQATYETSAPTPTSTSTSSTGSSSIFAQPTMYNLRSYKPDSSEPPVEEVHVMGVGGESLIEQAIVFKGIPAEAKKCSLNWKQADESERSFIVEGQGLTSITQLEGFPAEGEPVTFNSLRAFEGGDDATSFGPEFTGWPETKGASEHLAGAIDCSEDIYLRISVRLSAGDGFIYLAQDEKNGFYIAYTT